MIENSRTSIAVNAISSAIQVIIVGVVYFIVYRIIVLELGVDQVGIWSLILATTSITSLANFGFTSALIKYVAEANAGTDVSTINKLLFTSLFSMISIFLVIASLVYLVAFFFIDRIIEPQYVGIAMRILPLSLLSLYVGALAGVWISALEGFQKNYIKSIIFSLASVTYLLITVLLVPGYGLTGLAYAQVFQSIIIFALSYFFVKKVCPTFKLLKWQWDGKLFRQLLGYGYKIQMVSICQMLIDPITKVLITKYSGLTTLGFYEMASRLIVQLRYIIVNMNQVTIPIVSHYSKTDNTAIKYIYERGISFIVFLVFPLFSGIILFTPFLSEIWIGQIEPVFINCVYILAISMLINIMASPAYFNSLGEGKLNDVVTMNLIILILNILFGVIFGNSIPTYGVVFAWGVSYAVGAVFLIWSYQRKKNFSFLDAITSGDLILIIGSIVFSVISKYFLIEIGHERSFNTGTLLIFILIYFAYFITILFRNRNFKLLRTRSFLKT